MLIDIELERFVRSWAGPDEHVDAGLLQVNDTSGERWALGIQASSQPVLWLAVADEITVHLLLEQLRQTPGLQVESGTEHLEAWSEVLPIALTHLLATESFLDFDGLDGLV